MQSLNDIKSLNEYVSEFGKVLTNRILAEAKPLFTPGNAWDDRLYNLHRKPYQAQGDVIMALSKTFEREKAAILCAEMGTGKTIMSMSVPYIHSKGKFFRSLVICPGHITPKWKREIEATIPDSRGIILRKLKDVQKLVLNSKPKCNEFYILSKDKGKLSYSWKPAVVSSRLKAEYLCPDCFKPIFDNDGVGISLDDLHKKRMFCKSCKSALWSADNNKIIRFALGEYIKKYLKGYFNYLIADEVHQYKGGNTAQGNMFGSLASACSKIICLTGTLAGGYADELHYILYRASPKKLVEDNIEFNNVVGFAHKYGKVQTIRKISLTEDNMCSKGKKDSVSIKRIPGISPLVYSKFLMSNTVFLHLSDLAIDLPAYNEKVESVEMGETLEYAYKKLESSITAAAREAISKGSTRLLGILIMNLLAYPDKPFDNPIITDPIDNKKLIAIPKNLSKDIIYPKEIRLIKIIKEAKNKGRKVWVFCEFTNKRDVTERLKEILTKENLYTAVLKSNVSPEKRENWIKDKVEDGVDVMISGSKLVETGIDLLDFPEIVFYEQPLSCYTLRQASRRSWRLNQTEDVNVSFLYYKKTMQDRMLKLLGEKMNAGMALEGKITDDGLASVSSDNMMTRLAKELINGSGGVDGSVDAVWKKINISNRIYGRKKVKIVSNKIESMEAKFLQTGQKKKVVDGKVMFVDFIAGSKRKKKNDIRTVSMADVDVLMAERGIKEVQLSLFG